MNDIFRPFLRRFVLVFFDDILVYSNNLSDHLLHLQQVLEVLQSNQLYAKLSKCQFGVPEIAYLGHLISSHEVRADPSKLAAMDNWPVPHNIKSLRGFLGLTGYYRKFVQGYGALAAPLTALFKKNAFVWTHAATEAFTQLKAVVTSPPVLRLPDFTKDFVIECDASGSGLGAVLMQEGHPIAFFSHALKGRALLLSTYDKELLSLVSAVQKWRPYLLGRPFRVKTDQQALKYLLEQKVATVPQQRWISKLMGYDFIIEYKRGSENRVADVLSRQFDPLTSSPELTLSLISFPTPTWVEELKASYAQDQVAHSILLNFQQNQPGPKGFSMQRGLLLKKGRLWLVKKSPFQCQVLEFIHSNPTAGHSGFHKTLQRAKTNFIWQGMHQDIKTFVRECAVCQVSKPETIHPPGLLQPLPIPTRVWSDISMDFIDGLPSSHGFSVIMVVVDRFQSMGILLPFLILIRPRRWLSYFWPMY